MRLFFGWMFVLLCSVGVHGQIYAYKVGVLAHGEGPISNGREQGYDLNVEAVWDTKILRAYPAVGIELNNQEFTNFLYAGLSWEGTMLGSLVWELFFGGAVHDGKLQPTQSNRRALGSRFLFREAIAIGMSVTQSMSVTIMYDHYSHSGTDESLPNQGSDNTGIRFNFYY